MKVITKKAYAKVNLFLDVISRFPNGYHEIHTVMQTVSLCDDVILSLEGEGIALSCDNQYIPQNSDNIAWRAAELFLSEIEKDKRCGVRIDIKKRIPVCAGLGGGSADAAAVLCGLNELFDSPISHQRLLCIGAMIGADVPFCMTGGTVYACGTGEVLTDIEPVNDCYIVIAVGGEGVSTPFAYSELDREYNNYKNPLSKKRVLEYLSAQNNLEGLYNVFERVILPKRPVAQGLKNILLEGGASVALMSGSGPSVFGIFYDKEKAQKTSDKIGELGYFSYLATPVNRE